MESVECKIKALRQLAKESANRFQAAQACETRKRPKSTVGVSPSTASARAPAKRTYMLQERQLFTPVLGEESSDHNESKPINTSLMSTETKHNDGNIILSVLCHPLAALESLEAVSAPVLCENKILFINERILTLSLRNTATASVGVGTCGKSKKSVTVSSQ